MASAAKTSTPNTGSAVFLAWAIHFYAWIGSSVVLVLANAIHLFLPPWCVIPIAGWGIAILIHGAVTFFLVDKLGGNFKQLADQYIIKFIPKSAVEKIEAKLK